jgi:predicted phosphodiesterase
MNHVRTGLLSDIHGNAWALEAVLEDAAARRVDRWINLGDVLYGPLAPLETYRLLTGVDAVTVCGNEDRLVHETASGQAGGNPTVDFVLRECGPEPVEWLRALPPAAEVHGAFYACHGAPESDTEYLLEDVSSGRATIRAPDGILRLLGGVRAPVVVCGHSHIHRTVQLPEGPLVVNPGSVGLPAYDDDSPVRHRMETFSPNAAYAIMERRGDGWLIEHYAVPYDYRRAVRRASHLGRGDWARWLTWGCVT